jgi:phosphomannomutase
MTAENTAPNAASEELAALLDRARAWRDQDPDPVTSKQLDLAVEAATAGDVDAVAELHRAFDRRIAFGTAGLRGEMGPGPAR